MSGSFVAKGIQTKVSSLVAKFLVLGIACHQAWLQHRMSCPPTHPVAANIIGHLLLCTHVVTSVVHITRFVVAFLVSILNFFVCCVIV